MRDLPPSSPTHSPESRRRVSDGMYGKRSMGTPLSRSKSEENDPLQRVSAHRRSSFKKSALLKVNQREALERLHIAVCKTKLRTEQRQRAEMACFNAIHVRAVVQIQAAFRGYSCRKNHILCAFLHADSDFGHRRACSEITMSEFGDSVLSLGSLDWDPTSEHARCDEDILCKDTFHTSSSTPLTQPDSVFGAYNDSFSTLFSQDSFDVPIKRPSRKRSPMRPRTPACNRPVIEEPNLVCPPFHDPRSLPRPTTKPVNHPTGRTRSLLPAPIRL